MRARPHSARSTTRPHDSALDLSHSSDCPCLAALAWPAIHPHHPHPHQPALSRRNKDAPGACLCFCSCTRCPPAQHIHIHTTPTPTHTLTHTLSLPPPRPPLASSRKPFLLRHTPPPSDRRTLALVPRRCNPSPVTLPGRHWHHVYTCRRIILTSPPRRRLCLSFCPPSPQPAVICAPTAVPSPQCIYEIE